MNRAYSLLDYPLRERGGVLLVAACARQASSILPLFVFWFSYAVTLGIEGANDGCRLAMDGASADKYGIAAMGLEVNKLIAPKNRVWGDHVSRCSVARQRGACFGRWA